MIFSFTNPEYLFLLLLVPIVFFIHFMSLSNRKKVALKFANFDAIARIQGIDFFSKNITNLFLMMFIVLFMVLAVSGLTLHSYKDASSFSFVLVIDSSQSMEADDFPPDRITAAKDNAKIFVDEIPYELNVGVVSFAGSALIEQEMSKDRSQIKSAIDKIELKGFGGTDLYEAIITSTNMLREEENKAIILLSDGQINVGTVDDVVKYAQENDVIIHSIGIGTLEGGQTSFAISKIDEEALKSIAYNTGGVFFNAENQKTLGESFSEILGLTNKRVSINLSTYLILLAVILFVLEFFLANTKYINFP